MRHLVYPLKTVLDDSIGCAVWFAAKGKGIVGNGPNRGAKYTSTARVMFGVHTVLPFLWSVRHEAGGRVKILPPPPPSPTLPPLLPSSGMSTCLYVHLCFFLLQVILQESIVQSLQYFRGQRSAFIRLNKTII